jgi:hypothetical protein
MRITPMQIVVVAVLGLGLVYQLVRNRRLRAVPMATATPAQLAGAATFPCHFTAGGLPNLINGRFCWRGQLLVADEVLVVRCGPPEKDVVFSASEGVTLKGFASPVRGLFVYRPPRLARVYLRDLGRVVDTLRDHGWEVTATPGLPEAGRT